MKKILCSIFLVCILAILLSSCTGVVANTNVSVSPSTTYNQAKNYIAEGRYEEAYDLFSSISYYSDSATQLDHFYYAIDQLTIYDSSDDSYVVLSYEYNKDNFPSQISNNDGEIVITYDNFGRIIEETDGVDTFTYVYDDNDRIIKKKQTYYSGAYETTEYEYFSNGSVRAVYDSEFDAKYSYDKSGNLTSERRESENLSFVTTFDNVYRNGRLMEIEATTCIYSKDDEDLLFSDQTLIVKFKYDKDGNVQSTESCLIYDGEEIITYIVSFEYNALGNIISMEEISYDPDGSIIREITVDISYNFVYSKYIPTVEMLSAFSPSNMDIMDSYVYALGAEVSSSFFKIMQN